MLRILIADDHEVVRRGVRGVIEAEAAWEVCGEASDGEQALELATREQPDVAILDVNLPKMSGVDVTRRLRGAAPHTKILLFTLRDDHATISAGLEAGARGYLLKTDGRGDLVAAISALGTNRTYFSAFVSEMLLEAIRTDHRLPQLGSLTNRELQIVRLIANGYASKQIAGELGISAKTVDAHRAGAMRKAGVTTSANLVRFAIRQHLIAP